MTAFVVIGLVSACAMIETNQAKLSEKPDGVRVYPPKVYLFVGTNASWLTYAPDFERAYDVKPITILAKQDFKIELGDGQLNSLTASQDTTAILTFLQSMGELGAKAAGVGVSSQQFDSTFGLNEGIWAMDDMGVFRKKQ